MKKYIVTAVAILGLCVVIGLSYQSNQPKSTMQTYMTQPTVVQVVEVQQAMVWQQYSTVAQLQAEQFVTISTAYPGRLEHIYPDAGSYVEKGTLLATLIPNASITAPFSGHLSDWKLKPGAFATAGAPLIDLIDKSRLLVDYFVPEQYAEQLKLGQTVFVSVRTHAGPALMAKVVYIAPLVNLDNHSILVRASLNNVELGLLPGSFAEVTHRLGVEQAALVVPEFSLVRGLEGYSVLKVQDEKIVKQPVTVGAFHKGRVHLTSGVSEGEKVIITHTPMLTDGKQVVEEMWTGVW